MLFSQYVKSFFSHCWWTAVTLLRVDFMSWSGDYGYQDGSLYLFLYFLWSVSTVKLLSMLILTHGLVAAAFAYCFVWYVLFRNLSTDNNNQQSRSKFFELSSGLTDAIHRFSHQFRPWFINERRFVYLMLDKFRSLRLHAFYRSPFLYQHELVLYYLIANQSIFALSDKVVECLELLAVGFLLSKGFTVTTMIVFYMSLKAVTSLCMRSLERFVDNAVFSCCSSRADKKKMAYRIVLNFLASVSTRLRLASSRYLPLIMNPYLHIAHKIRRICKLGHIDVHSLPYLTLDGVKRSLEMKSYFSFIQFYSELTDKARIFNVTRYLFQDQMGFFTRLFLFVDDSLDRVLHPVWTILMYTTLLIDVTKRSVMQVNDPFDPVVSKVMNKTVKNHRSEGRVTKQPNASIITTASCNGMH